MRRIPLAVAVVSVLVAAIYLVDGRQYSLGTMARPGLGFYPLVVGVLALISSVMYLRDVSAGRDSDALSVKWPDSAGLRRILVIAGGTACYLLLLPRLGDLPSGALLVLLVLRTMGMTRWTTSLATSVAMAFAFHYVFRELLGVALPLGILSGLG